MPSNSEDNSSQSPQLFRCPSCGAALEVADTHSVTCRYCGNSVPMPDELRPRKPHTPQVVIQTTTVDYSSQYAEAAQGARRVGLVIAVFVLLLVGVVAAFTLFSVQSAMESAPDVGQVFGDLVTAVAQAPASTPVFAEPALEFGGEGTGPGLFDDPRYIAVDKEGGLYVADYDDGRVQKFDAQGEFVWQTTLDPDDNGNLYVGGLAADYRGNLYVTRSGDLLKLSTEDGALVEIIPGEFPDTQYDVVAVDPNNVVYALHVSASDDELIKLSEDGEILGRWPEIVSSVNKDDAALNLDLAVDGAGQVYVSSSFGNQVYVYDSEAKFTDRFGREGNDPGAMNSPGAIAVDGRGRIYVNNFGGVDVYGPDGDYIDGMRPDYTRGGIRDIAIDIDGNIYIVTTKGFVVKYRPAPRS